MAIVANIRQKLYPIQLYVPLHYRNINFSRINFHPCSHSLCVIINMGQKLARWKFPAIYIYIRRSLWTALQVARKLLRIWYNIIIIPGSILATEMAIWVRTSTSESCSRLSTSWQQVGTTSFPFGELIMTDQNWANSLATATRISYGWVGTQMASKCDTSPPTYYKYVKNKD